MSLPERAALAHIDSGLAGAVSHRDGGCLGLREPPAVSLATVRDAQSSPSVPPFLPQHWDHSKSKLVVAARLKTAGARYQLLTIILLLVLSRFRGSAPVPGSSSDPQMVSELLL